MAAPIVPGFSNVLIDAVDFTKATQAFGDKWDLWAGFEVERVMDQSGEIVQRAVRKRAKRHYRTGSLERNVRVASTGAGYDHIVRVHSGGRHAHLVAGNVGVHVIKSRPQRTGPLAPKSPALALHVRGGVIGFAESVEHPATHGDPYFHVGAMNSRLAINAVLKASAKKMVTHLAELTKGLA